MPTKTILVCGGRDFIDFKKLKITLDNVLEDIWHKDEDAIITIISGEAIGADFLAKVYVKYLEFLNLVKYKGFPANWKKYGREAGSIRNQQMLDEGKPDLVVAFPGGSGTADMVRRARQAGVEVIKVG